MLHGAAAERREGVAALEHRDHSSLGVAIGHAFHLLGDPGVIGIGEAQHRHVVFDVRIEPGGEGNQLGPELLQRRQPFLDHGFPELLGARSCRERHVVHVARRAVGAAVRIERVLEDRGHQHLLIALEDVLRAVAVVHVEVDDRDALEAVRVERVARGNRYVIEDAESHRPRAAGVMSRRPHRAEGGIVLSCQHEVGSEDRGAGGAQGGLQAERVHRGVRIEMHRPRARRGLADRFHVLQRMHAAKLLVARERRVVAREVLAEAGSDELVLDGREALGALGMMHAHFVA